MQRGRPEARASARPTVVYWNNLPAPYMVDRFNALARRGKVSFEVWFSDREVKGRSWRINEETWAFPFRYVPRRRFFGRVVHLPIGLLIRRRPQLLVTLYAEPAFIVGFAVARLLGTKTAFRVLKTYSAWVRRSWIKERIKRYLFSRVDAIETPGEDGAGYAEQYGVPRERVYFATHTVDMKELTERWGDALDDRDAVRAAHRLNGVVFLYVGRLWVGKGLLTIFESLRRLRGASETDATLLLIGDGPDEEMLRGYCRKHALEGVVFAGYQQKDALPRFYAAADVFVFPTLGDPYGIVVDEAMACGLPVISTTAAGEIAGRVKEGVTGYTVPPGNSEAMAGAMLKMMQSSGARAEMGRRARELVSEHTPERWAEQFETMVGAVICDGATA